MTFFQGMESAAMPRMGRLVLPNYPEKGGRFIFGAVLITIGADHVYWSRVMEFHGGGLYATSSTHIIAKRFTSPDSERKKGTDLFSA